METSRSNEVKTRRDAASALVPLNIFQLVLELPGDVPNAPQRAGLPVLVQEVGLFGREVAFDPTDAPSMRRTLDQSIRPGPDVGPVEVPVRGGPVGLVLGFRRDFRLVLGHDGLDVVLEDVAFFFSFFVFTVGVGGPFPSAGEQSIPQSAL